jgi:hypothetical protein
VQAPGDLPRQLRGIWANTGAAMVRSSAHASRHTQRERRSSAVDRKFASGTSGVWGAMVDEVGEFQGLRGRWFQKQAANGMVVTLDRNGCSSGQTRPPYPNPLARHAKNKGETLQVLSRLGAKAAAL